jgi:lipopolysaccharide biosynthesis protein
LLRRAVSRFRFKFGPTRPLLDEQHLITDVHSFELHKPLRLGVYVHLYYDEYLYLFRALVHNLRSTSLVVKYFITTPHAKLAHELMQADGELNDLEIDIRITPNVGRNFGPLFSEFANTFSSFDFCLHLHTKKSPQLASHRASAWSLESWERFGLNSASLLTNLNLLSSDASLGYSFIWNPKVVPSTSFNWGINYRIGAELCERLHLPPPAYSTFFPAGGMFICRPQILDLVGQLELSYTDFPEERRQLDGQLQHALERLIGQASLSLGFTPLIYVSTLGGFLNKAGLKAIEGHMA